MENKTLIHKLKNNAELAQAAYGYYDLITNDTSQLVMVLQDEKGKDKIDSNGNPIVKQINLIDVMDSTFKNYDVYKPQLLSKFKPDKVGTLKGDMTPSQVKRFFNKYELLDFYPKLDAKNNRQIQGFHACLFQDKETKEYTLAIRGSFDSADYATDAIHLAKDSTIPFDYLHKMIVFYESCAKKYPVITKAKGLNVVGHSLGGCLAQLFALSFATNTSKDSIINEVYTFNSPGAKDLKPHNILDSDKIYEVDENIIRAPNPDWAMFCKITKRDPNTDTDWWEALKDAISQEQNILTALRIYFSNIPSNELKPHKIFLHSYAVSTDWAYVILYQVYPISATFINAYQTLTYNYNNKDIKGYKLSISDRIFHIETDSDNNPNNTENNLIQNLGEDIEGKHYYLNIGIDIEWLDRHSISSSVIILYFYEYLLDLEANRVKLSNRIKELESKPLDSATLNYIGYKAAKNQGKYQLITALFNDFMQWNYNSLKEVNKEVLNEIKKEYEKRKQTNKDMPKPPAKIFPLVYLLSEVSYIVRIKDNKKIQEFDMYKMIDTITQLQEAKLYIKILDKEFFDSLEDKQCSVAELRSMLKCQPFMVVDENNQEVLNESNRTEAFYYKTFNNLVSQILQSYKTA